MKKIVSLILLSFLALMMARTISNVSAQEPWAQIIPQRGTVETDIFLQVRDLGKFLEGDNYAAMRDMELFLYWDYEYAIFLGEQCPTAPGGSHMHYFDLHLSPPNVHPYSDLGNHTIFIQIFKDWATYLCNFTLTFEIIEQLPCDEWLALNATYTSLLNEYVALNSSHYDLTVQYNALSSNYDTLLYQYGNLLGNYNSLLGSYSSLSSDYDAMNSAYIQLKASYQSLNSSYLSLNTRYQNLSSTSAQLQTNYNGLTESYNSLQSIHNTLTTNYGQLQGNYTLLVSSYNDLQSENNNLSAELTNYRDLSYVMIITTIVFLATTIYFARRKPKTQ